MWRSCFRGSEGGWKQGGGAVGGGLVGCGALSGGPTNTETCQQLFSEVIFVCFFLFSVLVTVFISLADWRWSHVSLDNTGCLTSLPADKCLLLLIMTGTSGNSDSFSQLCCSAFQDQ